MKNILNQLFFLILLFLLSAMSGNAQCPTSITGFTAIGEFEGSKYFISNDAARPTDAQTIAESNGGYLAVITSQTENDFIQQGADGLTYIGLNDFDTEGNLEWVNGEALSYNNISPCGFCNENSEEQDFVVIQPWDGGWSFSNFFNQRKYIIEIPCGTTGGLQVNCDLNIDPAQLTVVGTNDPSGNVVNWTPPTATTDCPDGVTIEQISGMPSGSFFTAWFPHIVVYEVTDGCGNSQICYYEVFIEGTYGDITCPADITVQATSPDGAVVNYDLPEIIEGTCIIGTPVLQVLSSGQNTASGSLFPIGTTEVSFRSFAGGSNTYCQTSRICSFNVTVDDGSGTLCPGNITGFTTLGEFGESKYYISNAIARPVDAQAEAATHGGYLVTINSQAENDFIQQYADGLTYIGLTDENTEGTYEWFNGEAFSYNNINPCGFCNENSANQDYAVIQPWDGGWSFSNFFNQRKYIMEVPCNGGGGNDGCGFITSTTAPGLNVFSLGSVDFREVNDKYLIDLEYNGANGPNVSYTTKTFSQQGVEESSTGSANPTGFVYEASINGLTIDLTGTLNGNIQWTQNIPITTNDPFFDEIVRVEAVSNANGIDIFGSYHFGNAGIWRTFVIKTDLNGNFISQILHDTIDDFPTFGLFGKSKDGGFYMFRRNSSATAVVNKIGANGEMLWEQNIIGDLVSNRVFFIGETADASALYIGINQQFNTARVRKYNTTNGDLIWNQGVAFGGGMNFTGGVVTQDDGVVAAASYSDFGSNTDFSEIFRVDSDGNEVWQHNVPYGLRGLTAIGATEDGGFLFYLNNQSLTTGIGRIIKVNSDGLFDPACTNNELPDLSLGTLQLSSNSNNMVGDNLGYSFQLHNNSLTAVSNSYTLKAYLQFFDGTNEMEIGSFSFNSTPYGITEVSDDFIIPNVSEGTYKIVLRVDTGNDVEELFETNNELTSFNFIITAASNLPDLSISSITNFPNSGDIGEVIFFTIDLNNSGNTTATGSYDIHFYISSDNSFSADDIFAGEIPTGDTPVGIIPAVPAAITVPSITAGEYFLLGVVDIENTITESNENNNTFARFFEITSGGGGGCPTTLSGFTSLGEFNGSAYFLSNDVARPTDAQNEAMNNGGNLAVINSQGENDFLFNQINELVYIGINDETTEGTLEWVDGSSNGFTNFDICSFCNENTSNFDYVVMHGWNGGWSWSSVFNQRKYIVEIPCAVQLTTPNVNNALIVFPTNETERDQLTFDKLMPNPANQYIFASIFSPEEKELEIQIIDVRGVLVKSKMIGIHKGSNTIEIDINELSDGVYMMVVPDAPQQQSMQRFVKFRD